MVSRNRAVTLEMLRSCGEQPGARAGQQARCRWLSVHLGNTPAKEWTE